MSIIHFFQAFFSVFDQRLSIAFLDDNLGCRKFAQLLGFLFQIKVVLVPQDLAIAEQANWINQNKDQFSLVLADNRQGSGLSSGKDCDKFQLPGEILDNLLTQNGYYNYCGFGKPCNITKSPFWDSLYCKYKTFSFFLRFAGGSL